MNQKKQLLITVCSFEIGGIERSLVELLRAFDYDRYDVDVLATQSMENKTVPELFSDFYRLQNNDQEPSDAHLKVLTKVLRELEETP